MVTTAPSATRRLQARRGVSATELPHILQSFCVDFKCFESTVASFFMKLSEVRWREWSLLVVCQAAPLRHVIHDSGRLLDHSER